MEGLEGLEVLGGFGGLEGLSVWRVWGGLESLGVLRVLEGLEGWFGERNRRRTVNGSFGQHWSTLVGLAPVPTG